mgnify:CR=1 FL=1
MSPAKRREMINFILQTLSNNVIDSSNLDKEADKILKTTVDALFCAFLILVCVGIHFDSRGGDEPCY